MSKMRVVMITVALGCAIGAGLLAKGVLGKKPEDTAVDINAGKTVDVLVAARDVLMGGKFSEGVLVWRAWPKDTILPSMITKETKPDALQELLTARARLAIYEGETVIDKKIVRPGQGSFMGALLQKGMRATSVAISARSSAGGFILPDDRVDVIRTKKFAVNNQQKVESETVISNVRVLAINQIYNQATEGEAVTVEKGETATLELTPQQTEVVAMAESSGELSLALRSIAESDGKSLENNVPVLAEKYDKESRRSGETLFMRYGVAAYAAGK